MTCPGANVSSRGSNRGITGRRSASRFERTIRMTTAKSYCEMSRCFGRFRSTVTNASNSPAARASSSPLRLPAQPIQGTVCTSWPGNSPAKRRSTHSSSKIFKSSTRYDHTVLSFLQKRQHLLARYRGESLQKLINRFATFQAIDKCLDWHARPGEHRRAAHDVCRLGDDVVVHTFIIVRFWWRTSIAQLNTTGDRARPAPFTVKFAWRAEWLMPVVGATTSNKTESRN